MESPFFEDLEIGKTFETPVIRIYGFEVDLFYLLTDHGGFHMDAELAKNLNLRDRVIPGLQLLSYTNKMIVRTGLFKNAGLFLGLNNIRFLNPVFPGDPIHLVIEVIDKKEVEKWGDRGFISYRYTMLNADNSKVLTAEANMQFIKRN